MAPHPPSLPKDQADFWQPSRYNIASHGDSGRVIVGNLFSGVIEVIPEGLWDRYLSPGTGYTVPHEGVPPFLMHLFDQGLLVSSKVDELERVKVHFQQIRHDISGQRVLVAPTMACNLRCSYCFEAGTRRSSSLRPMSIETEGLVVDYILAQCEDKQELILNWFGGEPLLGLKTIERISEALIEGLHHGGIDYRAQITTNGVLLNAAVVRRLKALGVNECQLTVDIPKENKLDKRGQPALEKQLDKIAFAAELMDVKLRLNVGADVESQFDALYDALRSRRLEKNLHRLNITPVLAVECGTDPCEPPPPVDEPGAMGFLMRERRKAKALGFPVSEPFPSAVKPCGATCITQTLIDPQGFLYKCPSDLGVQVRAFGSVDPSKPFRPHNLLPWLTYDWFQFEDCSDCKLLPRCAGGCPHRRMYKYGGSYCLYNPHEVAALGEILDGYRSEGQWSPALGPGGP